MNADIETADIKPLVQRDPRADKDRAHARWVARRMGAARRMLQAPRRPVPATDAIHAKLRPAPRPKVNVLDAIAEPPRARNTRIDPAWQVKRSLTRKRIRAAGKMLSRWWKRYSRGWQEWYIDRIDQDDTDK